jgi:purine-binding chemotaxis protein CheW
MNTSKGVRTVSDTRQLCTFLIDGMLFGVDVMNVQEVIRYQEMTVVPLASSMVRGLINLRGQIVTAIDVLEVEERTYERAPETMGAAFRELVPGVFKLDGKLLLLLDAERVATLGTTAGRPKADAT